MWLQEKDSGLHAALLYCVNASCVSGQLESSTGMADPATNNEHYYIETTAEKTHTINSIKNGDFMNILRIIALKIESL